MNQVVLATEDAIDGVGRIRLAAKAKILGRKILAEVATIVTPET